MLTQIRGLHHVTSIARDAQENNTFFTRTLGLRRVKKTVNFDRPDLYHLYYGGEFGTPGTVLTYFPTPNARQRVIGTKEVGMTVFSIPGDAFGFWKDRLGAQHSRLFGEERLVLTGPDGDEFALVDARDDRAPWTGGGISADRAIRGFHSVSLRLQDGGATAELLHFLGYRETDRDGAVTRYRLPGNTPANTIDVEVLPDLGAAKQGAGSVHHIAFAVANRQDQQVVRSALIDAGFDVTPVKDRNYFWAIYFRAPGGVLFEIATNEPGFDIDEDIATLGSRLCLPPQYEPRRAELVEKHLAPIQD